MENFKNLSNVTKIEEIADYNLSRNVMPLVEQYALALVDDNQSVIQEFEAFGDSLRHIIENRAGYERGLSVYGFTDKTLNQYGWLERPDFLDCEEIPFMLKGRVLGENSITIGRGPNGKWTYGLNLAASITGHASGLSVYGEPYNSRKDCMKTALERFIAWHQKVNDKKTEPVIKESKDMLDVLTGRKPVQMSLF
jgi:hypothetical protein